MTDSQPYSTVLGGIRALQGGKSYYVLQPVLKFYYVLQVLEILLQSIWNLVNYKLFEILLQGFEV